MTYAELDERANRCARLLIGHGIRPDTLAALAVERSLELVVATLAILKAGAGYVPVDPEHPAERIAAVIEASAPRLMVTTSTVGLPSMPVSPTSRSTLPTSPDTARTGSPTRTGWRHCTRTTSRTRCSRPARRAHPRA